MRIPPHIRVEKLSHYVDRGHATPCRIFIGHITWSGYGLISVPLAEGTGFTKAVPHRVLYEHYVGLIPEGMELDHLCRQRDCCEVTHLEAVTPSENYRRGIARQRAREYYAAMTHCIHGHEFTPKNTYVTRGNGHRQCRACSARRSRDYAARQRKERAA